jgi:DNA-binding MarR family transcriptional regulator
VTSGAPGGGLRLSSYLPYRLSVASNEVSRLIARAYEDRFGLTVPQWRVIAILGETDELTQKDLIGRTAMDKVTISRAASALTERRLIARAADTDDARALRLTLTETGRAIYADVAPLAQKFETELLAELDAADIAALGRLLDALAARARALSG